MIPFKLVEPSTLREAVTLLNPDDSSVRPVAGGTALMLMMKAGVFRPTRLVSLRGVEQTCSAVRVEADGSIHIGALTRLAVLEHNADVRRLAPVIASTMRTLSNVRVRNVATVGGSLAHGDPYMDLPPVLIALGATVQVIGPAGERIIPVEELITGYYETQLAKNELIVKVIIPPQAGKNSVYLKCTTRAAHDWPTLGVSVAVDADRDVVRGAKIVVSAAVERAISVDAAAQLKGQRPTDKLLRDVGEAAAESLDIIGDMRGSIEYKQQLVRVYVRRAIQQALKTGPLQ